ncbi:hypothetical protein JCM15519_06890 [Fundidesulfovibrio butyratiphilus]
MTPDAITKAIQAYVKANWTATPVQYDNLRFDPPAGPYISVSVQLGGVFEEEMGPNGASRQVGALKVRVFTPLGIGTRDGDRLSGTVKALFRRKDVEDVYFDEPYDDGHHGDDGHNRYMHVVNCPFWYWV